MHRTTSRRGLGCQELADGGPENSAAICAAAERSLATALAISFDLQSQGLHVYVNRAYFGLFGLSGSRHPSGLLKDDTIVLRGLRTIMFRICSFHCWFSAHICRILKLMLGPFENLGAAGGLLGPTSSPIPDPSECHHILWVSDSCAGPLRSKLSKGPMYRAGRSWCVNKEAELCAPQYCCFLGLSART